MSDHGASAVLDASGVIVSLTDAWAGCFNGREGIGRPGVGDSYLRICEHVLGGPDLTRRFQAACAGAHPLAVPLGRLDVSTPGIDAVAMMVCSRYDDSGRCVGATVSLSVEGPIVQRRPVTDPTELTFPEAPRLEHQTLQQRVLAVLDQQQEAFGFAAHLEFAGSPDADLSPSLAEDILAVARGALSMAARDAHASSVAVRVEVAPDLLTLEVVDDGDVGSSPEQSSRLAMMRGRAERNLGSLELIAPPGGGTHLRWTARCLGSGLEQFPVRQPGDPRAGTEVLEDRPVSVETP